MEIKDWFVEYGGVEKGYFNRNHFTTWKDFHEDGESDKYREQLNNTDMYCTLFAYSTDDVHEADLYAPLVFDLDKEIHSEEDFVQVVRDTMLVLTYLEEEWYIGRNAIRLYFSGSKGFHVEVPFELLGLEPSKALAEQYKILAQKVNRETIYKTIDMKIYERRRLFRVANTINSKTGLYKVAMPIDMLYGLTYADLEIYASSPKPVYAIEPKLKKETVQAVKNVLLTHKLKTLKKRYPKTIVPVDKQDLLPCVKKILSEGTMQGGRNNTCIAISSSLAQSGIEKEEAMQMVLSWNTLNEPPLPDSEVMRTVESGYQMAHSGRGYGCSFFKDNEYCIGEECKLY